MCARFTLKASPAEVAAQFMVDGVPELPPRYNIAPTQNIAAVRDAGAGRELAPLRWGLVPSWADDLKIGHRLLNARAETVATKPAFRAAYRKRRCLVPADGYYEWKGIGGKKQPYYFQRGDGGLFAFAGLWEHWEHEGQVVESCAIITTTANELARSIHDRMPVLLDAQGCAVWLDRAVEDPGDLLRPYPADQMRCTAVNPVVNNPRHEGPDCIEPSA